MTPPPRLSFDELLDLVEPSAAAPDAEELAADPAFPVGFRDHVVRARADLYPYPQHRAIDILRDPEKLRRVSDLAGMYARTTRGTAPAAPVAAVTDAPAPPVPPSGEASQGRLSFDEMWAIAETTPAPTPSLLDRGRTAVADAFTGTRVEPITRSGAVVVAPDEVAPGAATIAAPAPLMPPVPSQVDVMRTPPGTAGPGISPTGPALGQPSGPAVPGRLVIRPPQTPEELGERMVPLPPVPSPARAELEEQFRHSAIRAAPPQPPLPVTAGRALARGTAQVAESIGTGLEAAAAVPTLEQQAMERLGATTRFPMGLVTPREETPEEAEARLRARTHMPPAQALRDVGKTVSSYWREKAKQFPRTVEGHLWEDPSLALNPHWLTEGIFETAPSLAAAIIPAVGAHAAAIRIGTKVLPAAPATVLKLARIGAIVTGGAAGGYLEGASTYQQVIQQGGSPEDATKAMTLMGLASAGLNAISFSRIFVPGAPTLAGKAKDVVVAGLTEALTEYLEEPADQGIRALVMNQPLLDALKQGFKEGLDVVIPAGVLGAGARVVGGREGQAVARPTARPARRSDDVTGAMAEIPVDVRLRMVDQMIRQTERHLPALEDAARGQLFTAARERERLAGRLPDIEETEARDRLAAEREEARKYLREAPPAVRLDPAELSASIREEMERRITEELQPGRPARESLEAARAAPPVPSVAPGPPQPSAEEMFPTVPGRILRGEEPSTGSRQPVASELTAPRRDEPASAPLSIRVALEAATRTARIGGQPITSEDPVARDVLLDPALPDVDALLREVGATQLRPVSAGVGSIVFDLGGDRVLRLGRGQARAVPNIPEMLQPIVQRTIGGLRAEVFPRVRTEGVTDAQVAELGRRLEAKGFRFDDAGRDNVGLLADGQPVVLDPGAVVRAAAQPAAARFPAAPATRPATQPATPQPAAPPAPAKPATTAAPPPIGMFGPSAPSAPSPDPAAEGFTRTGNVDYAQLPQREAGWSRNYYTATGESMRLVGRDADSYYVAGQAGSMARVVKYPRAFLEATDRFWQPGHQVQVKKYSDRGVEHPAGPATIAAPPRLEEGFYRVRVRRQDGTEELIGTRLIEGVPTREDIPAATAPAAPPSEPAADYGVSNTVFTKDAADAALARLRATFSPDRLNAGVDFSVIPDLVSYGGYHFEAGLRELGAWSKRMVDDLGESVRPYLDNVFGLIRTHYDKATAAPAAAEPTPEPRRDSEEHTFSSTQIEVPTSLANEILRWARDTISPKKLTRTGNEQHPHVTLLFGLHTGDVEAVRRPLEGEGPIEVTLGRLGRFAQDEQDVLYIAVESPQLRRLHDQLLAALPNTQTFRDYQPHITLAYLNKGAALPYLGQATAGVFQGRTFTVDRVSFSPKDGGEPSSIALGALQQEEREAPPATPPRVIDLETLGPAMRQAEIQGAPTAPRGTIPAGGEAAGDEEVRAGQPRRPDQGPLEGAPPEDVPGTGAGGAAGPGGVRGPGADAGRVRGPGEPGPARVPGGRSDARGVGVPPDRGGRAAPAGRPEPAEDDPDTAVSGEPGPGEVGDPAAPTEPKRPVVKGHDYVITDGDDLGAGGAKTKYRDNVAAIRLLKQIEGEGRPATPEDQAILVKYVGWGGIPQVFDTSHESDYYRRRSEWADQYLELKDLLTEDEYAAARASTTNAHYTSATVIRQMWAGLQRLGWQRGVWLEPGAGVGHFAGLQPSDTVQGGRTLVELDSITGRILKALYPRANVQNRGYETVALPDNFFTAVVGNVPFGDFPVVDTTMDRKRYEARGLDRLIHDYFLAKSIDKLLPGGVMAVITSSGTMDKANPAARVYLAERAELLGAIRLPSTAFKQNALTEVTTDILFFQKRDEPITRAKAEQEPWVQTDQQPDMLSLFRTRFDRYGKAIRPPSLNRYFIEHPEMVLGTFAQDKLHNDRLGVVADGRDLDAALAEALGRLPANVYREVKPSKATDERNPATLEAMYPPAGDVRRGGHVIGKDGRVYRNDGKFNEVGERVLTPVELSPNALKRMKGLLTVRDLARQVLHIQATGADADLKKAQQALGKEYDRYVKVYGPLNTASNARLLSGDRDANFLLALEKWNPREKTAAKADIFTKRTVEYQKPAESATDPAHALLIALNETGRVDWDRIAALQPGRSVAELQEQLKGRVYRNPAGGWETAEEYLSGNVRQKLETARAAAEADPSYQENVGALEAVQPTDKTPGQIDARLGSAWMPTDDVRAFMAETFEVPPDVVTVIHVAHTGDWVVRVNGTRRAHTVAAERTYGTQSANGVWLTELALNQRLPVVYVRDGDGNRYKDPAATIAAEAAQKTIKAKFKEWVWSTPAWAERLARLYNDEYNNTRPRMFDGSHLTLPGMAKEWRDKIRDYQKHGIWRVLQGRNTLANWRVGFGKTLLAVASAMEARRLGLAKKVMLVEPNHMIEQVTRDFLAMYPGANVLAARKNDLEKAKRQQFMSRIATGEWDAIIVPHTAFTLLPVRDETWERHIREQIDAMRDALQGLDAQEDKYTVKQIEAAIEKLEARLEKRRLRKQEREDDAIHFEELGVDMLIVDESQNFKNLYVATKLGRVKGVPSADSQRAFDLFVKTQWLTELNGGRGVLFMSGTPISNTIAEAYTLMRYLMYGDLKARGLAAFDDWAGTFGEITSQWEMTVDGQYRPMNRFKDFANVRELQQMFGVVNDVQQDPATAGIVLPKMKGGQVIVHRSPLSQAQIAKTLEFQERVKTIQANPRQALPDNMLAIATEARWNSLDARLVEPTAAESPLSKINTAAGVIHDIWQRTAADRAAQVVFLDIATPKMKTTKKKGGGRRGIDQRPRYTRVSQTDSREIWRLTAEELAAAAGRTADDIIAGDKHRQQVILALEHGEAVPAAVLRNYPTLEAGVGLSPQAAALASERLGLPLAEEEEVEEGEESQVETEPENRMAESQYAELKAKLVAKGIPEGEIAFIHQYKRGAEQQQLFDDVNEGRIRLLIGSTEKMGIGTNVQRRLYALHHLDAPWRPDQIEQREGRIIRPGNMFAEVEIHQYLTEGVGKTVPFDAFLWQLLSSKAKFIRDFHTTTADRIEDVSDIAVSATQFMAISTGNPMILEKVNVDNELAMLDVLRRAHEDAQWSIRRELAAQPGYIKAAQENLAQLEQDARTRDEHQSVELTVGGRTYTERPAAEAALAEAAKPIVEPFAERIQEFGQLKQRRFADRPILDEQIGTYRGFALHLDWDSWRDQSWGFRLVGAAPHSSGPTLQGADAVLRNITGAIAEAQKRVRGHEQRAAGLRDELGKPFPQQAHLDELTARKREIDEALGIGQATAEAPDEESEEGEGGESVSLMARRPGESPEQLLRRFQMAFARGLPIAETGHRLIDPTEAVPAEVLRELVAAPTTAALTRELGRVVDGLRDRLGYGAADVTYAGLDVDLAQYGVTLHGNRPRADAILLNPWTATAELAREVLDGRLASRDFGLRLAEELVNTAVHEVTHQQARAHGRAFDVTHARNYATLNADGLTRELAGFLERAPGLLAALRRDAERLLPHRTRTLDVFDDSSPSGEGLSLRGGGGVPGGEERGPAGAGDLRRRGAGESVPARRPAAEPGGVPGDVGRAGAPGALDARGVRPGGPAGPVPGSRPADRGARPTPAAVAAAPFTLRARGPRSLWFSRQDADDFAGELRAQGLVAEVRALGAGTYQVWAQPEPVAPQEAGVLTRLRRAQAARAAVAAPPATAPPPPAESSPVQGPTEAESRPVEGPSARSGATPPERGAAPRPPRVRAVMAERRLSTDEAVRMVGRPVIARRRIEQSPLDDAPSVPAGTPGTVADYDDGLLIVDFGEPYGAVIVSADEIAEHRPRPRVQADQPLQPTAQTEDATQPNYRPARTAQERTELEDKRRLILALDQAFDVPIRVGRVNIPGARGIFKVQPEVIRLRSASNLATAAHEIGHFLRKRDLIDPAGYEDQLEALAANLRGEPLEEGIAEFVRLYVVAPAVLGERMPGLVERFEASMQAAWPEGLAALRDTRERYAAWRASPLRARVASTIDRHQKARGWHLTTRDFGRWWDRLYAAVVDDLHPIKALERAVGSVLPTDRSPYMLARLARGVGGVGDVFMRYGAVDFNTLRLREGVQPFRDIIQPVWKDRTDFETYLVLRRAAELVSSEQERLARAGRRLLELWEVSDQDVGAEIEALDRQYPAFETAAEELRKWNDALLDYIAASGRYDAGTIAAIKRLHENYVPLYRVFEELPEDLGGLPGGRRLANLPSPLKRLQGSTRRIISPLESFVRNAYAITSVANRNEVSAQLADLMTRTEGFGRLMEAVPPRVRGTSFVLSEIEDALRAAGIDLTEEGIDLERVATVFRPIYHPEKNHLIIYRNGQPQVWYVDPGIYKAMLALDRVTLGWMGQVLRIPARIFRAGIIFTPTFQIRNFLRDQQTAAIQGKAVPFVGYVKGLMELFGAGEHYQRWLAAGGSIFANMALDRPHLEQTLQRVMGGQASLTGMLDPRNLKETGRSLAHVMAKLTEASESPTRIGVFRRELEQLRPEDAASARPARAQALRAAFESREASLDFARRGGAIRAWTMVTAFMNPWLQGLDKLARTVKEHPSKVAIVGAAMIAVEFLLHEWNKRQPCYQHVPAWQRDIFWILALPSEIPGTGISCVRLPRPFEYGVLFGAIPRRLFEVLDEQDPDWGDRLLETTLRGFGHEMLPTALVSLVENYSNWDRFRDRPIVSRGLEAVAPSEQFNPRTTEVAKRLGRIFEYSPAKIDNLIHGYFGTLGSDLTSAVDALFAEQDYGEPPTKPVADWPIIRAFVSRHPNIQADPLERFYEYRERGLEAKRTRDKLKREGATAERLEAWDRSHAWELWLYPAFERQARRFSDWRHHLIQIERDPSLSGDKKREALDRAVGDMVTRARELVEGALETRRQFNTDRR